MGTNNRKENGKCAAVTLLKVINTTHIGVDFCKGKCSMRRSQIHCHYRNAQNSFSTPIIMYTTVQTRVFFF